MENDFNVKREGSVLTVVLGEELTRINAPALMDKVTSYRDKGVEKVIFDATNLTYISSSGVRVVIYCKKYMSDNTEIVFLNCSDKILDVLDIVGIRPFITFEKR